MARGDHIIAKRKGYTHHGIDAGDGTVIHFAGYPFQRNARAKIERWSLDKFRRNSELSYVGSDNPDEVVRRAESRLGEGGYNLVTNNCEHFTRWCIEGESRSPQVATAGIITSLALVGLLCWWVKRDG